MLLIVCVVAVESSSGVSVGNQVPGAREPPQWDDMNNVEQVQLAGRNLFAFVRFGLLPIPPFIVLHISYVDTVFQMTIQPKVGDRVSVLVFGTNIPLATVDRPQRFALVVTGQFRTVDTDKCTRTFAVC